MNHLLAPQMAHDRIDTFRRDAEGNRWAAFIERSPIRALEVHARLIRAGGRLRLVLRGAAV